MAVEICCSDGSDFKAEPTLSVLPGEFRTFDKFWPATIYIACDPHDKKGQIILNGDLSHLQIFSMYNDNNPRLVHDEEIEFSDQQQIIVYQNDNDQALVISHRNPLVLAYFHHSKKD